MKRIFLIFGLLSDMSLALEKNNLATDKNVNSKLDSQTCVSAISSLHVHEMMADRNLAFYNAWMIMWADFPEEFTKLLQKK